MSAVRRYALSILCVARPWSFCYNPADHAEGYGHDVRVDKSSAGCAAGKDILGLAACSSGQPFFSSTPTIYDLTQRPAEFANKDVTAQGFYLWKPGDPAISLLVPALSTADGVRDAQPIYASVECCCRRHL